MKNYFGGIGLCCILQACRPFFQPSPPISNKVWGQDRVTTPGYFDVKVSDGKHALFDVKLDDLSEKLYSVPSLQHSGTSSASLWFTGLKAPTN